MTTNTKLYFLFIEPNTMTIPTTYYTLKISPLYRKLILTLTNKTTTQHTKPITHKLIHILFNKLPQQPQQQLHLPISSHPKIHTIIKIITKKPIE